ncbi:MAG: hypothetical protein AAFX06_31085 [Planctomycetota bacterium]
MSGVCALDLAGYSVVMDYDDEDDFEDDFDYDEFVEREFGSSPRAQSVPYHWQVVAMGLVALFFLSFWISLGFWTPF